VYRTASALLAAILCAAGVSCGGPAPPASADPPRRLLSLAPSHTETLIELGLGERIVGISDFCPEVPGAVRVGGAHGASLESIARLAPDRVFSLQSAEAPTVRRLRSLGIRVVSLDPQSFEAVVEAVETIGRETGAEERAAHLATQLRARMARVGRSSEKRDRASVYVELQTSPLWTVGPGSFVDEALARIGARNVFDDLSQPYSQVSAEAVVARAPEVILSFASSAEEIRGRPAWKRVPAVARDAVVDDFPAEALLHASPRLFDGLEELERRLEPYLAAQ